MNLKDVKVDVFVKLCDTKMKLSEIESLKVEDLIKFDKEVNEKVEIFANNVKIGEGEVVTTDKGNFGVVITNLE
jgi:flagellar motor switch protein FliN/FliY